MIENYTIPFLALIAILFSIIHEEKFIAFEGWFADRIGYIATKVVIWFRQLKSRNG